eukprot:976572-Prymnesium_polylepis.2
MSEGAMPDLAGEVVAQLEKLHDADRSPLHLAGCGARGVTLSMKQNKVHVDVRCENRVTHSTEHP